MYKLTDTFVLIKLLFCNRIGQTPCLTEHVAYLVTHKLSHIYVGNQLNG